MEIVSQLYAFGKSQLPYLLSGTTDKILDVLGHQMDMESFHIWRVHNLLKSAHLELYLYLNNG